jgi:ABC-type branched-subunit amino acid transport system substrate-binding protein
VAGQAQRDPAGVRRVHVSLPLDGPQAWAARDTLRGAELAVREGFELVIARGSVEENARAAADDPDALAHLGDFHSRDVAVSAPILGEAGLLQVAPVATWTGLGGPTLVRLSPHDGVFARFVADWLAQRGVGSLLLVHDHDEGYGVPVGRMCEDAARARGLAVTARPVWDSDAEVEVGDAGAVLYVGVAGSGAVGLWHTLHARAPSAWLLGSDGVAVSRLSRALSAEVAARSRFFVAQRAPFGFYGYEAMALIQDCAGLDRAATVAAARATHHRDSVLGRYSIDADGLTTTSAYGVLEVVRGELVWA